MSRRQNETSAQSTLIESLEAILIMHSDQQDNGLDNALKSLKPMPSLLLAEGLNIYLKEGGTKRLAFECDVFINACKSNGCAQECMSFPTVENVYRLGKSPKAAEFVLIFLKTGICHGLLQEPVFSFCRDQLALNCAYEARDLLVDAKLGQEKKSLKPSFMIVGYMLYLSLCFISSIIQLVKYRSQILLSDDKMKECILIYSGVFLAAGICKLVAALVLFLNAAAFESRVIHRSAKLILAASEFLFQFSISLKLGFKWAQAALQLVALMVPVELYTPSLSFVIKKKSYNWLLSPFQAHNHIEPAAIDQPAGLIRPPNPIRGLLARLEFLFYWVWIFVTYLTLYACAIVGVIGMCKTKHGQSDQR